MYLGIKNPAIHNSNENMDQVILTLSFLRNMYNTTCSRLWMTMTPAIGNSVCQNDTFPDHIVHTLKDFIQQLNYTPEPQIAQDNTTLQTLRQELQEYNNGAWFDATCVVAASLAELPYPLHSQESKLMVARFTWFLLRVDDMGKRSHEALAGFQKSLVAKNTDPEEHCLQAFRDHLLDWYKLWDPVPANCINLAGMDFINGWLLEETPSIRAMKLTEAGQSWANFLRVKTGSGSSYAFMIFPKELEIDISVYIQVMDDITLFANYANDIFSFYKEELQGETNNYIHNRAFLTGKSIPQALRDVCDETAAACARIEKAFKNTKAEPIWKRFINGYIAFHLHSERYYLYDIGL